MKQSNCIEDPAGFAEGGDAGGQAGGKARSTEAYRLLRGPLFSKKITPPQDWVMERGKKTRTSHAPVTEVRNFTFSLAAFSAGSPL